MQKNNLLILGWNIFIESKQFIFFILDFVIIVLISVKYAIACTSHWI